MLVINSLGLSGHQEVGGEIYDARVTFDNWLERMPETIKAYFLTHQIIGERYGERDRKLLGLSIDGGEDRFITEKGIEAVINAVTEEIRKYVPRDQQDFYRQEFLVLVGGNGMDSSKSIAVATFEFCLRMLP